MPPRKLPPDDELVAMYRSGMSSGEIAEALHVAKGTVTSALWRIGEPARPVHERMRLRSEHGRTNQSRYWLGKKQSAAHVEARLSKIRGEQHYAWKDGVSDPREYRQVIDKEQCARCESVDRLAIHHLNYDHYDNQAENLQVLCLPCHSSVHKQAYWDAIHAGVEPPRSNAPINWQKGRVA